MTNGTSAESLANDMESAAVRSLGWSEREQRNIVAHRGLAFRGQQRDTLTTVTTGQTAEHNPPASDDSPSGGIPRAKRVSLQEARAVALAALERAESQRGAALDQTGRGDQVDR